jgi:hypothetical protein
VRKKRGNSDRHRRVELKTVITSEKKWTGLQDPQEDPRAGIREESTRDVQRVSENEEMDLVKGSAPSETRKEIIHGVGTGNVRAPTTRDSFAPPKKKENG